MSYPPTPELDRRSPIIESGRARLVQDFYDWLQAQGIGLWKGRDEFQRPIEYHPNPEDLLCAFFGIDRRKVENERRAILAHIRSRQEN